MELDVKIRIRKNQEIITWDINCQSYIANSNNQDFVIVVQCVLKRFNYRLLYFLAQFIKKVGLPTVKLKIIIYYQFP